MQLSNHVVNLSLGKPVCIDLKNRTSCLLNFITGDFSSDPWASYLQIDVWAYLDQEALSMNDASRTYCMAEKISLSDFIDGKKDFIRLNKEFKSPHLSKLEVTYQKIQDSKVPAEVELSYTLI